MADIDPNDPLLVHTRLGAAVEREMEGSAILQVIREAAAEEREMALYEFANTDPRDAVAISRLQQRFSLPDAIERWVQAAIERGQVAAHELREDAID